MRTGNPRSSTFGTGYGSPDDERFIAKYHAHCRCDAVRYEVRTDPVDAKICHCSDCQLLHGAPMQWAAIFHKRDVRFTAGVEHLRFYNSTLGRNERIVPCKVACAICGSLIADEFHGTGCLVPIADTQVNLFPMTQSGTFL